MKKLIRYRIPISRTFSKGHKRAGGPTYFVEKILSWKIPCGLISKKDIEKFEPFSRAVFYSDNEKLHTIRANYPLWEKRFKKIMASEAVLELYYWSGKPYRSKPVVICQLGKDDGVGLQEISFYSHDMIRCYPDLQLNNYKFADIFTDELAKNDGLSLEDFNEWFKNYDLSKPLALIHFTKFRY